MFSPRPSGNWAAAHPRQARWGARSKGRPLRGGAHARAGGAGTSRIVPAALRARAPPPSPTGGAGYPALPLLAPAASAAPGHLRGARREGREPGLPCVTARRLHRAGEARLHGRSPMDDSNSVQPRYADQLRVLPLRGGAPGRGPRPVGLPGVGACKGDVASLGARGGGGPPLAWAAGPVAGLLAEGRPLPPPARAGGGAGTLGQVPIPPVRHVPCSSRSPYSCGPQGPGERRGLPVPGLAAAAALQPLPLG